MARDLKKRVEYLSRMIVENGCTKEEAELAARLLARDARRTREQVINNAMMVFYQARTRTGIYIDTKA
jgi:hypothetical protein